MKKKLTIFLFLNFVFSFTYADIEEKQDSFFIAFVQANNDSTKVNVLYNYASFIEEFYPDSTILHLQKTIDIFEKHQYTLGKAPLYSKMGDVYFRLMEIMNARKSFEKTLKIYEDHQFEHETPSIITSLANTYAINTEFDEAVKLYKQALKAYENQNDEKGKSSVYNNMALTYYHMDKIDSAEIFYKKSYEISVENNDIANTVSTLSNLGMLYDFQAKYSKAIEHYNLVIEISKENDNPRGYADGLANLGVVYSTLGDHSQALELFFVALPIFDSIQDYNYIIGTQIYIGQEFLELENFDRALEHFNKSLEICKSIENRYYTAQTLLSIAQVYNAKNDFTKAIEFFDKALIEYQEFSYSRGIANCYDLIGKAYHKTGDYETALNYFFQALDFRLQLEDLKGAAKTYNSIAETYMQKAKLQESKIMKRLTFNQALVYSKKALEIQDEIKALPPLEKTYDILSKTYKELGDYTNSVKYFQLLLETKDTLFNIEKEKKIQEVQTIYEVEKKEQEIINQKIEIEKKGAVVKQQKTLNYSLLIGLVLIIVLLIFVIRNNYHRKKANRLLKEINLQISERNHEISLQSEQIVKQNKEITDSLKYAKKIQNAVLPPDDILNNLLPDHFVFFKPKHTVSGDFYWIKEINNKIILAVADCTGHGVPGGFMSMLGVALLNEIVRKTEITQANQALNELRNQLKDALRQTGKEGEAKDGINMGLCVIDKKDMKMQFAGAYNPLYHFRNGDFKIVKGDRVPIGIYLEQNLPFTNHVIDIIAGDTFYLFTDGYPDQFGGENNRKLKLKSFKELLNNVHSKDLKEQKSLIKSHLYDWQGSNEQVDDVLVLGFKI